MDRTRRNALSITTTRKTDLSDACPAFLTYSTVPPTTTTTTTAMRTTECPNDHTTAPQQSIRNNGPGPISSKLFLT